MTSFDKVYESTKKKVPYDSKWENGTGYLNGLCNEMLGLKIGEVAKTVDGAERKILMMGTPYGNIVIFQRYTGKDYPIVCNESMGARKVMIATKSGVDEDGDTTYGYDYSSAISEATIERDWVNGNLGIMLDALQGTSQAK